MAEMIGRDEIVIKPGMGALHYWCDIWRYRELFYFLAWRDIGCNGAGNSILMVSRKVKKRHFLYS